MLSCPRAAAVAAGVALNLFAAAAPAAVIRVPTEISSFRVAVQTAAPGDTVQLIGNGGATYVNSNVGIDKDLTIQGGFRADFVVRDPSTYVSVVRDTVEPPSLPLIRVVGAVRVTFDGVWLWGGTVGVRAEDGADLVFRDCVIRGQRNSVFGDPVINRGGALRLVRGSALFERCRIQSINTAYSGSGIAAISATSVIVRNSVIANCLSTRFGGGDASGAAVFAESVGELRFEGTTLSDCGTVQSGGLVMARNTSVIATDCDFLRGLASTNGGAFSLEATSATFDRCTFEENRGIAGGAIRMAAGSTVTIRDSRLVRNRAAGLGGAIWSESSTLVLDSITFEQNHILGFPLSTVPQRGGAVYVLATEASAVDCTFTNERATGKGGAWFQIGGNSSLMRTRFESCDSGIFGGAAAIELGGRLEFENVLMKGCSARYGGGVAASFTGAIGIDRGTIVEGTARGSGAAVYVDTGGTVDLKDSILGSALQGDLVFCESGAVRADHCDVWNDDTVNIRVEWGGACPDPTGTDGNLKVSPGFCAGDPEFRIPESSPCAGSASDGGDLGWLAAGCSSSRPLGIEPSSWGRIKSAWRDR